MKTHTGEKPFACPICNRSFISGSNLKQHKLTHRPEGTRDKYACKFCDKILLYASSIRKHAQLCHKDILESVGNKSKLLCDVIRSDTGLRESLDDGSSLLSEKIDTHQEADEGMEEIEEIAAEENGEYEETKRGFAYNNLIPSTLGNINEVEGEGMDMVYLQSELSDNFPLVHEQSIGYLLNDDINKSIEETLHER